MATDRVHLTIGEMIERVPEGGYRIFERTVPDGGEERYFLVHQSWDYDPVRLEWGNRPGLLQSPWAGSRTKPRVPLATLPPPEVSFAGPASDLVDLYTAGPQAFFISDPLFRLIDSIDPGSLEHVEFRLRASDSEVPFHAVLPDRVVQAIDTSRTTVLVKDEGSNGVYFRRVRFPDGIRFDDEALHGTSSFSDLDAYGWYWSKDLIELAERHGIRGLYAQSVASSPAREIARL